VSRYSELYERLSAMHEKILNRILKELNMKGYAFEKFYSNTLLYKDSWNEATIKVVRMDNDLVCHYIIGMTTHTFIILVVCLVLFLPGTLFLWTIIFFLSLGLSLYFSIFHLLWLVPTMAWYLNYRRLKKTIMKVSTAVISRVSP